MATKKKIKLFKNPLRASSETLHKPYVPQYQVLGVKPEISGSTVVPMGTVLAVTSANDLDNPRTRKPSIRQSYAPKIDSPLGHGPIPNVGNNMEQVWSSMDNEIIDDVSGEFVDINHPMIDNNEVITWQDTETKIVEVKKEPAKPFMTEKDLQNAIDVNKTLAVFQTIKDNEYVLIVKGDIICSGSEKDIENQTRQFVFGEHELCHGEPVSIDDITVLRKVKIKMGVFLE